MADKKSPSRKSPQDLTTSSLPTSLKDTAKIQKDLESVSDKYKNQKSSYGFLTDLSNALGIEKENASEYVRFTAKNGTEFTIRISNHNANTDTFKNNEELKDNISIVVKSNRTKNTFKANDNVELTEYVYFKEDIAKSDANVLSQIAESLSKTVEDGTYTDVTGLARVNNSPTESQEGRGVDYFLTSEGEIYGFTKNGKIYFIKDKFRPEVAVHEYTHLWNLTLQKLNSAFGVREKNASKTKLKPFRFLVFCRFFVLF